MTTTSSHHATAVADAYEPVPLLKDKVVVLSGVGPGLGRSLGEEAARMGADLVLVSRTERRLEKMADVVRSAGDAVQHSPDAVVLVHGRAVGNTRAYRMPHPFTRPSGRLAADD